MRYLLIILCSFYTLVSCSQSTSETDLAQDNQVSSEKNVPDPERKLVEIIRENHIPKSDLSIKIDKSAYALSVYNKDTVLITYPCVFGFNAIDDKAQEGDGCTPEGKFGVRSKYAHKSWNYFIWIDYPNKESWSRFNRRKANGEIGKDGTIGGEVGIHGVPEGGDYLIDERVNWTLGCISLKNDHVEDLYKCLSDKVQIEIVH